MKNDKMMEITLKDGTKITGREEGVLKAAGMLGEVDRTEFYLSESRGTFVRISEMHPVHRRNAVLKAYMAWLNKARDAEPKEFFELMYEGPTTDESLVAMIASLKDVESWD